MPLQANSRRGGEGAASPGIQEYRPCLSEAGYSFENVVKTTVYLQNMADFGTLNEVYAEYFREPYPARVAFQVAALPKGALAEAEVIAVK